jgi:hypothetical protein
MSEAHSPGSPQGGHLPRSEIAEENRWIRLREISMNLDPIVTFIIVLVIGIAAGIIAQRIARRQLAEWPERRRAEQIYGAAAAHRAPARAVIIRPAGYDMAGFPPPDGNLTKATTFPQ